MTPELPAVWNGNGNGDGLPEPFLLAIRGGDLQFDRVPEGYQREPCEAANKERIRNWCQTAVGPVMVSEREDGSDWAYDGQQRALCMIAMRGPEVMVPCYVQRGMSRGLEALSFYYLNAGQKPITAGMRYHAAWLGGEPEVLKIVECLKLEGWGFSFFGSSPNTVCCWSAMHGILKRCGAMHLRRCFGLGKAAWGAEANPLQAMILEGLSLLILRHRSEAGWNDVAMAEALSMKGTKRLLLHAGQIRAGRTEAPIGARHAMYRAMHATYNKGRRSNRLSPLPD